MEKLSPTAPAVCFFLFWLINLAVVLKGIEYIRILQGISAPVLLGVGLLLLGWAYHAAGGFGPMLSVPSRFTTFPDFLKFLIPALNGTVGFWATVSLNIPDFTRFARNQREQVIGQALALPTTMTLYAFVGIAVTSATVVIYGTAIWDPVQLLSRFHSPVAVVISLLAILLATLNVNIGANVVSPANDFSNLWPRGISFRTGGVITCFMGIALMPWKLLANYGTFIFGWLGGYAAFLGPVAGIMICDYFVIRRRVLQVDDLYLARRDLRIFARIQLGRSDRAGAGSGHRTVRACDSFRARPVRLLLVRRIRGFVRGLLRNHEGCRAHACDCSSGSRVSRYRQALFVFQKLRQHLALVTLQCLLFIPAHQINVELGHARLRRARAVSSRCAFSWTDQAKAIDHFVRNKFRVVAAHLAMVLIIVVAAILHKRSQRGRQIFRLVLPDQIHHVVRHQRGEPAHSLARDVQVVRDPHRRRRHHFNLASDHVPQHARPLSRNPYTMQSAPDRQTAE